MIELYHFSLPWDGWPFKEKNPHYYSLLVIIITITWVYVRLRKRRLFTNSCFFFSLFLLWHQAQFFTLHSSCLCSSHVALHLYLNGLFCFTCFALVYSCNHFYPIIFLKVVYLHIFSKDHTRYVNNFNLQSSPCEIGKETSHKQEGKIHASSFWQS